MSTYTVRFRDEGEAEKVLRRLDAKQRRRIQNAILALASDPRPHGCTKLAARHNQWHIREGDYRIIYTIEEQVLVVVVLRIGHRSDVYG